MHNQLSHLGLLLAASSLVSWGGWIFGKGRCRVGLVFGVSGVVLFLVDHLGIWNLMRSRLLNGAKVR
jgi:hypothetical protein